MSWKITPEMKKAEKEADEYLSKTLGFTFNNYIDEKSHPEPAPNSEPELKATPKPEVITAKEDAYLSTYKFPFTQEQLLRMEIKIDANTSEYYKSIMQEICFDMRDASGNYLPYPEIRERFLACSIMLNILGEIAPRFRPIRIPQQCKKGVPYPDNEILLSNDLQIIDLNWIHRQGLYASDIVNCKGLFDSDKPFDIEKAAKFASKLGTKQLKAQLIALPPIEQFQLAALQSKDVISHWTRIKEKCFKNQIKVKEFFTKPGTKYKDEAKKYAGEIYKAILIGDGSPTAAHKIFCLMTGSNTITKKNFERYINGLSLARLL